MADEQDPEMIRQQMEMQRAALAAKLETLENKIVETVEGAREAVAETVQTVKEGVRDSVSTVKETVQNSVESVKETFDLRLQVERHPWAMMGGAVAVGFAAGYLLNRAQRAEQPHAWGAAAGLDFRPAGADAVSAPQKPSTTPPPAAARESWGDHFARMFAPELNKLKGMAIGAALGVIREMFTEPLPEPMRPQFNELVDSITVKLGGEPVQKQTIQHLFAHRAGHPNGDRQGPPDEPRVPRDEL